MSRLGTSALQGSRGCQQTPAALELLSSLGVQGVEVAPTRLPCPPAEYRNQVADAGLAVSSLQAILHKRPDLQLFGDMLLLRDHFARMAEVAHALGAGVMVFGAPANRRRGNLPLGVAWDRAVAKLRSLADAAHGVVIGLEPVPEIYGGDFLTHWFEVWKMVREVDRPGLRVHLDTACVDLAGDSIGTAIRDSADVLAHYHASQPDLGDFKAPLSAHWEAAEALEEVRYQGWMAIEMRQQPDWRRAIARAVSVLSRAASTARTLPPPSSPTGSSQPTSC